MSTKPLILKTDHVGPWGMNTYALICPNTNESVLFDPGADSDKLLAMLGDSKPLAILLTHTHADHVGALAEMREKLDVPVYVHPGQPDAPDPDPIFKAEDSKADHFLNHGDTFKVGAHTLNIYHAPGHIHNQICYAIEGDNRIIVGDTIFEGGPGKTWTPQGFQTTLNTLREVVLPWPDDTVCYPGHGPHFVLGQQRAAIEAFLAKDHPADFCGDATWA